MMDTNTAAAAAASSSFCLFSFLSSSSSALLLLLSLSFLHSPIAYMWSSIPLLPMLFSHSYEPASPPQGAQPFHTRGRSASHKRGRILIDQEWQYRERGWTTTHTQHHYHELQCYLMLFANFPSWETSFHFVANHWRPYKDNKSYCHWSILFVEPSLVEVLLFEWTNPPKNWTRIHHEVLESSLNIMLYYWRCWWARWEEHREHKRRILWCVENREGREHIPAPEAYTTTKPVAAAWSRQWRNGKCKDERRKRKGKKLETLNQHQKSYGWRKNSIYGLCHCQNVQCRLIMNQDYNASINIQQNLPYFIEIGNWLFAQHYKGTDDDDDENKMKVQKKKQVMLNGKIPRWVDYLHMIT